MSWMTRLREIPGLLKKATVEPYIFFFMFGYVVRLVSFQSLLIDRACRINLNYSEDTCNHLDDHVNVQSAAVRYGNNLYVGHVMISTIPALVLSTFLGPWSDIYGRRLPLILANVGILVDAILAVFITASPDSSPYLFLLTATISGMCGGLVVTLSSTYSYLADITSERSRPTRFAILEFFFVMGMPLGTVIGGQAFTGGYLAVMIIGPVSFACALLWAVFMLKETKPRKLGVTKNQMLKDLVRLDNVRDSFRTCTAPRPGNLRLQIWLLVIVSCSTRLINMGSLSIGFPFSKTMYKWGVTRYSNATTIFNLCNAVAMITLVPFLNRKMRLHEAAMGLIGVLSLMTKMVILSVAFQQELIYYAWFGGILHGFAGIAIRSRISKLVSRQELGRVFSLVATCESLTPVLGTISMTQIYNASVDSYPGLVYCVSAIFLLPSAIIFAWMSRMPTMSFAQYQEDEEVKKMKEMKDCANFM